MGVKRSEGNAGLALQGEGHKGGGGRVEGVLVGRGRQWEGRKKRRVEEGGREPGRKKSRARKRAKLVESRDGSSVE